VIGIETSGGYSIGSWKAHIVQHSMQEKRQTRTTRRPWRCQSFGPSYGPLAFRFWTAFDKLIIRRYNGRQVEPPKPFPPPMEEACAIIENTVNAAMRKRDRFPLEWAGLPPSSHSSEADTIIWRANFAASNCYEGAKETVGFHSDRLTNLGPYPTIASLSLGTLIRLPYM